MYANNRKQQQELLGKKELKYRLLMVGIALLYHVPVLVDQMMAISVIQLMLVPMVALTSVRERKMVAMNQ